MGNEAVQQRATLSVVIVVYNSLEPLRTTLTSLRSLKSPPDELVVIDGCSTDGSSDLIAENSDLVSKYLREPDSGIFDAMNKGLDLCTQDYVQFLNCGDVYHNSQALEFLKGCNAVNMPDYLLFPVLRNFHDRAPRIWWPKFSCLYNSVRVSHAGFIASRRSYRENGGYDTMAPYTADSLYIANNVKAGTYKTYATLFVECAPAGYSASATIENLVAKLKLAWSYPTSFPRKAIIGLATIFFHRWGR